MLFIAATDDLQSLSVCSANHAALVPETLFEQAVMTDSGNISTRSFSSYATANMKDKKQFSEQIGSVCILADCV